ncbi:carbamoyl phosphate synthase-like protein [compost metagenome]
MKILITGGKTATALKLIKAFNNAEIILGDYGDMPNISTSSYSFAELGKWNADILAHNLLTKCLDNGVDLLLPLYEAEITALSKSLVLFDEFGIKVLVPKNPQLNPQKFKDWCVFENGELIYSSVDIEIDEKISLNGAYTVEAETKELALISIPNSQ